MARKFTLVVIFALAMCVLIVPAASTTFASESPSTEYYNVQYDFSYEETVMPTNQIVRKYEKPETSVFSTNSTTNSVTKTKAILASLGMGEDFIDELSTERLNEYANSKSIIATTSYIKTTPEGVSTYITKQEAEEGSRAYDPPAYNDFNEPGIEGSWSNDTTDSYMELLLVVAYYGNARYHYSANAEWLTVPNDMRWLDTIAVIANSNTVDNSTARGYFRYTESEYVDDTLTSSVVNNTNYSYPSNNLQLRTDSGWQGYALAFYLPQDSSEQVWTGPLSYEWHHVRHSNIKAHVEFNALITHPDQTTNFNVIATYSHSTVEVVADFGVDIGINSNVGIHLSLRCVPVNRYVTLPNPITYTP